MLRFRNLAVTPDDPVELWGPEGVLTAIERGGLVHIRRIMAAVAADPQGEVAEWVCQAAACTDQPVAHRLNVLIDEWRGGPKATASRRVRDAIDRSGRSLRWLAAGLGTSASRLSTYATGKVQLSAAHLIALERLAATQH